MRELSLLNVATRIGLSAIEWNIKCSRSSEGSGCQIAFPVYNSSETPKYRIAAKHHLNGSAYSIGWDNWQNFSDGGNADTVDNKHASDFMQNLGTLTTGSLLDYVLTMTNSGYLLVTGKVTDTPVSGVNFFVDVRRHTNGDYSITATRFNAGGVYTNRYNAGMAKWYGWANVADGGNADTLDSKHASDFSQIISFGDTPTDTKTAIGIPFKTTTYWCSHWTDYPSDLPDGQGTILAINYKGSGTAGSDYIWTTQIYISATSSFANPRIYFRTTKKDSVSAWRDIADGGNAASVGGKTITVTDVDPGAGSALGTGEIVFVTEVT